jgi:hypothetical protein
VAGIFQKLNWDYSAVLSREHGPLMARPLLSPFLYNHIIIRPLDIQREGSGVGYAWMARELYRIPILPTRS